MYDMIIRGGMLVDGTGSPRIKNDIAIADGQIAAIGTINGEARKILDATGKIVAPGFIDPHTHYDAQVCWDPVLSTSILHGVTTVVLGNCGVGIAPCKAEDRESTCWDLVNVEAIPYQVLKEAVPWDWETTEEYVASISSKGLAPNVGYYLPLSALRKYVMGAESAERAATDAEREQVCGLIREGMKNGALGFSTTRSPSHIGYEGKPFNCRLADRGELLAYAAVLSEVGRGSIQMVLTEKVSVLSDEEYQLLDDLLEASGRPVMWLAVLARDDMPTACDELLDKAEPLIRKGGIPQIAARPMLGEFTLRNPFFFGSLPSWKNAFNKTVEEQMDFYADADFRERFSAELSDALVVSVNWEVMEVGHTKNSDLKAHEGKTIAQLADEQGKSCIDAFLDIAIADQLETEFVTPMMNTDEAQVGRLVADDRTVIGLSDAGAHLDMLCDASYCTWLLGHWVREKQVMSLEKGVSRLTSAPAKIFGLGNRGVLAEGMVADIVVFDEQTIGSPYRATAVYDLPGGAKRMLMDAWGVEHTLVAGELLVSQGEHSGSMPGRVLGVEDQIV